MKESLAKTLYDLVRAEQFVPFSILFASGQRSEIKSRDHGKPEIKVLSKSRIKGVDSQPAAR